MSDSPSPESQTLLVTGATGYIGGRLIPHLLSAGYHVRALVRDPVRLQGRDWLDDVEVYSGNVLDPDSLGSAMEGVSAAYYLIHSMGASGDFHARDVKAAENFARAAEAAHLKRIIYLGGLGDPDADLSDHLRSRQLTGDTLRKGSVPVTELRAAVIVGSGSISFEMIRYLTELLPVMICPTWVYTRIQPIGIGDVLEYLTATLTTAESAGEIIEIGGNDVMTYGDMMLGYAEVRGLKRRLLAIPALTPRLSSHWVHWMTPVSASVVRPLIEGLRNEVIVRDDKAKRIFPGIQPMSYHDAVAKAIDKLEAGAVETTWNDALVTSQGDVTPVILATQDGMLLEQRQLSVRSAPARIYPVITRLGGDNGWPLNLLWQLRGILDRLIGGVGFRRGRRSPDDLRVGDALDFWRVETIEVNRLLRLRAEMKVPGRAWLQFDMTPMDDGQTRLTQTAYFAPKGLFGFLYWYVLYPIHSMIFSAMIRQIAKQAQAV